MYNTYDRMFVYCEVFVDRLAPLSWTVSLKSVHRASSSSELNSLSSNLWSSLGNPLCPFSRASVVPTPIKLGLWMAFEVITCVMCCHCICSFYLLLLFYSSYWPCADCFRLLGPGVVSGLPILLHDLLGLASLFISLDIVIFPGLLVQVNWIIRMIILWDLRIATGSQQSLRLHPRVQKFLHHHSLGHSRGFLHLPQSGTGTARNRYHYVTCSMEGCTCKLSTVSLVFGK